MIVVEQIKQAIRVGKIVDPNEKNGFIRKRKETNVNTFEKVSYYNSYQKPSFVSNMNFSSPLPKSQPNTLKN
jgi:hypothetical protein